jgi:glycerol-3-phosphate acyltransferase PlsY
MDSGLTLEWGIVVAAYLLGSLPTALFVVRWATGMDIRTVGSKNPGATNAARAAGLKVGLLVTVVDVSKGVIPVLVMRWYHPSSLWLVATAAAAILGHIAPLWLRFRGGKGVATGLGAFLVLSPYPALAALGVWIAVLVTTRYVALASMTASAAFPILLWFIRRPPEAMMLGVVGASLLIVARHVGNLRNLVHGNEPTIDG